VPGTSWQDEISGSIPGVKQGIVKIPWFANLYVRLRLAKFFDDNEKGKHPVLILKNNKLELY
jgi:hypothetical protein